MLPRALYRTPQPLTFCIPSYCQGGQKHVGSLLVRAKLSFNCITQIGDLARHRLLRHLDLSHNSLERITGLGALKFLKTLDLSHNCITEIAGLEGLSIRNLNLSNNKIKAIANLGRLPSLEKVNLSSNQIVGAGGLEPCTLLRDVDISNNAIVDVEEYFWLKNLRFLKHLDARAKPPEPNSDEDRIL